MLQIFKSSIQVTATCQDWCHPKLPNPTIKMTSAAVSCYYRRSNIRAVKPVTVHSSSIASPNRISLFPITSSELLMIWPTIEDARTDPAHRHSAVRTSREKWTISQVRESKPHLQLAILRPAAHPVRPHPPAHRPPWGQPITKVHKRPPARSCAPSVHSRVRHQSRIHCQQPCILGVCGAKGGTGRSDDDVMAGNVSPAGGGGGDCGVGRTGAAREEGVLLGASAAVGTRGALWVGPVHMQLG